MTCEKDPEQIIHFSLIPVCAIIERCYRGNGCGFISVGLDADTGIVSNGEKVVNDFESSRFRRVVHSGYVRNHGIFGGCVVFQEGDDRKDAGRWNIYSEFIFPDRKLLNVGGERGEKVLAVSVK